MQRAARACCDNLPHDLNSFTLCFFFLLLTVINTFSLLFSPLRHSLQLKPLTLSLSLILTPCSFPFPSPPPNFIHFSLFHSQSFLTDIIHVASMSVIYKDLDTNLEFLISCLLLAEVLSSFSFKQEKTPSCLLHSLCFHIEINSVPKVCSKMSELQTKLTCNSLTDAAAIDQTGQVL